MRRAVKVVAVVVSVVVAGLVLLFLLGATLFVIVLQSDFDFGAERRTHLDPIPIAATACPHVESMHRAANQFQIAYPFLGIALDAQRRELTWPEARTRLRRASDDLEWSIAAGISRFPPRVQRYLEATRNSVREGRWHLAAARNTQEFKYRTGDLFEDGQTAFGYAGDLIGHRCSVELRADDETMYPWRDTTATT